MKENLYSNIEQLTKRQLRQKEIIKLFQTGASYKAQDFAEHFSCSKRTITEDLKELKEHGMLEFRDPYYSMPEEFRSTQAYAEADMAASMMHTMFAKAIPQLDYYIDEIFNTPAKNSDIFYFDFNMEVIKDEDLITDIVVAINDKKAIEFTFTRYEENMLKTVFALKIANFYGNWYLIAYDLAIDKIRTYHLQDIRELKILSESFLTLSKIETLQKEANSIHSAWHSEHSKTVQLKVEGIAIEYIKRKSIPNITYILDTESELIIQMSYYNNIEVLKFVKQWLPYITILDNSELNSELQDILTEAISKIKS